MSQDLDFTLEGLALAGFKVQLQAGKDVFYDATVQVRDMPYLSQQIDGEFIFEDSVVTAEYFLDGRIGISIPETHYKEEPISTKTEEGLALLRDVLEGLLKTTPAPRAWPTARM